MRTVAHPWHGIPPGAAAPGRITVYVEMVPADTGKLELDKPSGLLRLDRPQRYSSTCPAMYGFVPRTLCGDRVARRAGAATRGGRLRGDGDPLDVCVLAERPLGRGGVLVTARPVGGFRMLDGPEVDDKIVAVLEGDAAYGGLRTLAQCPASLVERLRHYFLTYKDMPGRGRRRMALAGTYGAREAGLVIARAIADYAAHAAGAGAAGGVGGRRPRLRPPR